MYLEKKELIEEDRFINVHTCKATFSLPHTHEFLELVYVLSGTARHVLNDSEEQLISEGDFLIIDYNTTHSYKSDDDSFAVINCIFMPSLIDSSLSYCKDFHTLLNHYLIQLNDKYSQINIADRIFHDNDGKILNILNQMLEEYRNPSLAGREMLRIKMIEILIITARNLPMCEKTDTVSEIISKIHKSYNKNLTLSSMAEEVNYSLPYISKIFKERTGVTFSKYLQKVRINEACRLLANTNEKIWSISKLVGYEDVDFFCKTFKKITGTSPNTFRTNIK